MRSSRETLLALVRPQASALTTLPDVDWLAVVELAQRHLLGALLHARLSTLADQLPPAPRAALRQIHTEHAAHMIFLEWSLTQVIEAFRAASIPLVPYKGIPLARALYGDPALRLGGDLDVMVRSEDLVRSRELLLDEGWELEREWEIHHNFALHAGGTRIPLELHWISQREGEYHIPEARFWEEAVETGEGWHFSHEMMLLIIILHCARHFFVPYRQMVDIAHAVDHWHATLDWPRFVALAEEANALTMVATVLTLAHRDLAAPLPTHPTLVAALHGPRARLATRYLSRDRLLGQPRLAALDRYVVPLLHGDGGPVRLFLHDLLPPVELVAYRYGLAPDSRLIPLYRLRRPFELLAKHVRAGITRSPHPTRLDE